MTEHIYETKSGSIHYWINDIQPNRITLVMLPGLTADHHLFDKQVKVFQGRYNVLTWDAPGHGKSRPFALDFTLMDKSRWLHEILEREQIRKPVLIGQSMGGYVSQCFMEQFPGEAAGFISIDSAPLKRRYVTGLEIWLLKRTEPMYRAFPWNMLRELGTKGVSKTRYGQALMRHFVDSYTKDEYPVTALICSPMPWRRICPMRSTVPRSSSAEPGMNPVRQKVITRGGRSTRGSRFTGFTVRVIMPM